MAATNPTTAQYNSFTNCIVHGDCIEIMRQMPAHSVDFILTDPPYLVNYRDREGRSRSGTETSSLSTASMMRKVIFRAATGSFFSIKA